MDLTKILAKSNGENIIDHTNNVVNNVNHLLSTYSGFSNSEINILQKSAKLHDIGKIIKGNQDLFKTDKKTPFKFLHHVIGWYFIMKYVKDENKAKIANLVLWHHGNSSPCSDLNTKLIDLRNAISDEELAVMFEFCKYYDIEIDETVDKYDDVEDSTTENNGFNSIDNLSRAILVSADVYASGKKNIDLVFLKKNKIKISDLNNEFMSSDRSINQLQIAKSIKKGTTTTINAPTGFGKTIIGIIFSLMSKKQLIWVCPTNVIATSIYDNVIKTLKMIGMDISVELYLTGVREKANNNALDFSSDIIITNIDNFIKPSVNNSYGGRALMIYDCNVIFDEVHQYGEMNCALLDLFNSIMGKRHNQLNSTTLFLTATPTPFRFINKGGENVVYLPDENVHYKASHEKKYEVHFHDKIPYDLLKGEFVFFYKTVDDVQKGYVDYDGSKLISHGRYLDEDKEYHKNLVLDNYGKNGIRNEYGVFTNQILTTGCDYSVDMMFIKCPTILDFIQTFGRLNRWGKLNKAIMHIILEKNYKDKVNIGSENANRLQNLFITELRNAFEFKEFTLDEAYVFYNNFVSNNKILFEDVSRENLGVSKGMSKYIYPNINPKNKSNVKIANGNKLRRTASSDEIYITIKREESDEWVTIPFNVSRYSNKTKLFDEDEKTYLKQVKHIKKNKYYSKYMKITPELIIKNAIYFETPYPVLNHVYSRLLGPIKINK